MVSFPGSPIPPLYYNPAMNRQSRKKTADVLEARSYYLSLSEKMDIYWCGILLAIQERDKTFRPGQRSRMLEETEVSGTGLWQDVGGKYRLLLRSRFNVPRP